MKITLDSVVVASRIELSSELAGETILTSLSRGNLYALNAVAGRAWQLVQMPTLVRDLCDVIVAEFDVPHETCVTDVLALLEDLHAEGLLERRG